MTSKEKARELVEKFKRHANDGFDIFDGIDEVRLKSSSKQCALISVDEILKQATWIIDSSKRQRKYIDYWQEVKNEINKL